MKKIILLFILIPTFMYSQEFKIAKIIGANYFELDNGEKISVIDVKVYDSPKNLRWAVYNILNNTYKIEKIRLSNDTMYCKVYDLSYNPQKDLALIFSENEIIDMPLEPENKILINKDVYKPVEYVSNYSRPHKLMLGAGLYFALQSVACFYIAFRNGIADNSAYVIGGFASGIVAGLTIAFALEKEYIVAEGNRISLHIPLD
ncbi:MAG: hypothetical protein V1773_09930 [bacterium]